MSLTNEEQQQQNSLAKVKLAVDTVFSVHIEVARALGASDDALKAMPIGFEINTATKAAAPIPVTVPTPQLIAASIPPAAPS
jgi:hypothetical protein